MHGFEREPVILRVKRMGNVMSIIMNKIKWYCFALGRDSDVNYCVRIKFQLRKSRTKRHIHSWMKWKMICSSDTRYEWSWYECISIQIRETIEVYVVFIERVVVEYALVPSRNINNDVKEIKHRTKWKKNSIMDCLKEYVRWNMVHGLWENIHTRSEYMSMYIE